MRQQVNLYLPEFRRKRDWLDLSGMLGSLALCAVLLALLSGLHYWGLAQKQTELTALTAQLEVATRRTAALQSPEEAAGESKLRSEVAALEARLQETKLLLNFLQAQGQQNNAGLSSYLVDLARFRLDGVRLTGVQLREGGKQVMLNGEVLLAQNVPLFLQNLSRGKAFAEKRFVTLNISQAQDDGASSSTGLLSFAVATREPGAE